MVPNLFFLISSCRCYVGMSLLVVPAQPVLAEIVAGNSQDRVNVVGARTGDGIERLHILIFNKQRRAMNAVVYGLVHLRWAHPAEMELVESRTLNSAAVFARHLGRDVAYILF